MKLLLIVLLLAATQVSFADFFEGKVIKITDGDTVHVIDANHQKEKIRLAGIDTPERKQAFGHSFRHQWAQDRFRQLSGLECPIAGGPKYSELDQEQKSKWDAVAGIVNLELGHGKDRLDTTATYIGNR